MESQQDAQTTFEEMSLNEKLLRGIFSRGYERPSMIQSKTIPHVINKRDIIVQSSSGTGKTSCFTISSIQNILNSKSGLSCQVVILVPVKEIAFQVVQEINELSKYLDTFIHTELCVGGTRISRQNLQVATILVGTPGRVLHMLRDDYVNKENIHTFIMDECDELFVNFDYDVRSIVSMIPGNAQICIFSATINNVTMKISSKILNDPVQILVSEKDISLKGIMQQYVVSEDKYATLLSLLEMGFSQCVVFVNSIYQTENVRSFIMNELKDVTVCTVSSDYSVQERKSILNKFKCGEFNVLIATEVWARGVDVQSIDLVINFDVLCSFETYMHRIGRAGRHGRKGNAVNICGDDKDVKFIEDIKLFYDVDIQKI